MSLKQHRDAQLKTYQGPYFGAALRNLQAELDKRALNSTQLRVLAEQVPGFVLMNRPKTSDGYFWFWALYYTVDDGEIAILIPWSQDRELKDESPSDRSCAIYVRRNASRQSATRQVKKLTNKVRKQKMVQS